MSVCIPKTIACGWYSPEDGSPPYFIPGPEGCVLQSKAETRARYVSSEISIRSVGFGNYHNNSTVQLNKYASTPVLQTPYYSHLGANVPPSCGIVGSNSTLETLELTFTSPIGNVTYYYACQEIENTGSPLTCFQNGSVNLQAAINNDPNKKIEINNPDKSVANTTCMLSAFSETNLTGGLPGAPQLSPPINKIRTGPILLLVYVTSTEDINGNPLINGNYGIRYWNGACWKPYDSLNPSCTGSPPGCGSGPDSEC